MLVVDVLFDIVLFGDNDFAVAVAVSVMVVANFKSVDFVALAAGNDVAAVHASFANFVPAVGCCS